MEKNENWKTLNWNKLKTENLKSKKPVNTSKKLLEEPCLNSSMYLPNYFFRQNWTYIGPIYHHNSISPDPFQYKIHGTNMLSHILETYISEGGLSCLLKSEGEDGSCTSKWFYWVKLRYGQIAQAPNAIFRWRGIKYSIQYNTSASI